MSEPTLGAGPHVNKVVPSKRLKAAYKSASTTLSFKAWVLKKLSDERVQPWARVWLRNKG